ncbi:glycoside hydrolase family 65 protein, partial [Enterobacter hormaechei]
MLNVSVLNDPGFCPHSLNKYASVMTCGNGYMGIRATHEEDYTQQTRGMYLAGLYHCAGRNETTELVNLPDITGIDVELDGVNFTLLSGEILEWQRELAFANGELHRNVVWRAPDGKRYRLESRRFVSLDQLPLVAMQFSITPLDGDAQAVLKTGIDATQTNSGRQHLDEISVRIFDQHYMQGVYETQDRASEVVVSAYCQLSTKSDSCFTAKNRRLSVHHSLTIARGDTVTLEKIVWVAHRSEKALSQESFARNALADLKVCAARGYEALLESSAYAWKDVWRDARVEVTSTEQQDQ